MKKFLKNNIKLILVFLLGIIVSSGITAYAVNSYMSEQIRYQNNTFAINSVSEALDDLYSYSKNKIDNYASNNYSTEEQVVGTWIDGKPLYQKTFVLNSSIGSSFSHDILSTAGSNIDIIKYEGTTYIAGEYYTLQFYRSSAEYCNVLLTATNGHKDNMHIKSGQSGTLLDVTIQYTKTTDTATS